MKRFFIITGRTIGVFFFLAILIFSLAPYLLTNQVLPRLFEKNDIKGVTVQITTLTPWKISGSIRLGENSKKAALFSHFTVHYQPSEFISGRLRAIILDGITVRLVQTEGKLGLLNFPSTANTSDAGATTVILPALPLIAESIAINDCQILLEGSDHAVRTLNLQGEIRPSFLTDNSGNFTVNSAQIDIFTEGLPASLQAKLEFKDKLAHLSITATLPELTGLAHILSLPQNLQLQGTAQLTAELLFPSDFSAINHINAQLKFPRLNLNTNAFNLSSNEQTPLVLTTEGTSTLLSYSLKNINITQPGKVQGELQGTFATDTGQLKGHGEINTDLLQFPAFFKFQGVANPASSVLTLTVIGEKQQLQMGTSTIQIGPYQLNTQIEKNNDTVSISENVRIASIRIPEQEIQTEDITSQMTFRLAGYKEKQGKPGKIAIGKIRHKKNDLAEFSATLEQSAEGLIYKGELKSHLASPLRLNFSGRSTRATPLTLIFNIPQSAIDKRSLPSSITLPPGLELSGKIQANGTFAYDTNGPHGEVKVSLNDGQLNLKDKKVQLNGITTDITLPSLPQLTSRSRQQLQIAAINIGDLKFTDGQIFFRIEDKETLFIEKSRFTWCKGKVESGSLQISLTDPELSTTLYCDRLQFSELLSQFGISDTEGDGSLNGRLPLHFTGKEMIFDDGFLFSTPGNSGIVRFNNTAMLRQGLPEMNQAAYLEYSMQAMENFSYNWTKLTFNSTGDDLLISMQIDGKPASPLPFGYRSGQLVPQTEGQGIQHPIRLDVNFHLPFAQMFKYGQNLQKIMENK